MCTIVRISLPDEIQGTRGILSQDSLGCGFSLPHGVVATGQLGLSRHTSPFIILRTRNAIIGIRATAKPRTAFFHFRVEHYLTSINLIEHFSRYTTGTLLKSSKRHSRVEPAVDEIVAHRRIILTASVTQIIKTSTVCCGQSEETNRVCARRYTQHVEANCAPISATQMV